MRHSTLLILAAGAAALALTACSKTEDETATAGGDAAKPVASTAPAGSPAATKPKAGLWEQTMSGEGMPAVAVKICLDDALAEKALEIGNQAQSNCSEKKTTKNPDGSWTMESTCDMADSGKIQTVAKASGDFASAYKMEVSSTTTGAKVAAMNRTSNVEVGAKWLGPCPAGMNAGAREMNGMIIDPSGMK